MHIEILYRSSLNYLWSFERTTATTLFLMSEFNPKHHVLTGGSSSSPVSTCVARTPGVPKRRRWRYSNPPVHPLPSAPRSIFPYHDSFQPDDTRHRALCLPITLWFGINPPHIVAHAMSQPLLWVAVKAILSDRIVRDEMWIFGSVWHNDNYRYYRYI